nr:cytochrome P450 [Agasicles hygrophila]
MLTALLVGLLVIIISKWCFQIYRKNKCLSSLPGPLPIPFFGYKLPSDAYEVTHFLEDLIKAHGNTFKIYMGNDMHVFTADPKFVDGVLTSDNLSKTQMYDFLRPFWYDGLAISEGEKWKTRRTMCSPLFHRGSLKLFFERAKNLTDNLIQNLDNAINGTDVINAKDILFQYTMEVNFESIFGLKIDSQDVNGHKFPKYVDDFVECTMARNFSAWKRFDLPYKLFASEYEEYTEALNYLRSFTLKMMNAKLNLLKLTGKESNSGNCKQCLVEHLDLPNMSTADILEEVNVFVTAGYDTSGTNVGFFLLELSRHQEMQKQIFEEITAIIGDDFSKLNLQNLQAMRYLDRFYKEVLRLRSAVPIIERRIKKDCVINGVNLPKDTSVSCLLYYLHHNKEYYPDPEKFDPDRWLPEIQSSRPSYTFIPFSTGLRNCIGQKFATYTVKISVVRMLMEYQFLPVENMKLELGIGGILMSKCGFPVRIEKRKR